MSITASYSDNLRRLFLDDELLTILISDEGLSKIAIPLLATIGGMRYTIGSKPYTIGRAYMLISRKLLLNIPATINGTLKHTTTKLFQLCQTIHSAKFTLTFNTYLLIRGIISLLKAVVTLSAELRQSHSGLPLPKR